MIELVKSGTLRLATCSTHCKDIKTPSIQWLLMFLLGKYHLYSEIESQLVLLIRLPNFGIPTLEAYYILLLGIKIKL